MFHEEVHEPKVVAGEAGRREVRASLRRLRHAFLLQLQIMRTEMSKMIQPPLAVRRIEILRFDEI